MEVPQPSPFFMQLSFTNSFREAFTIIFSSFSASENKTWTNHDNVILQRMPHDKREDKTPSEWHAQHLPHA
jgi:hypothetical protein